MVSLNELKKLISKIDLEEFFKSHNLSYKEVGSSTNPQYNLRDCPFCKNLNHKGNTHHNRVYVGMESKEFICYNCNTKGSILRLAAKIEGISFRNLFDKYLGEGVFEALPDQLISVLEAADEEKEDQPIPELNMPSLS